MSLISRRWPRIVIYEGYIWEVCGIGKTYVHELNIMIPTYSLMARGHGEIVHVWAVPESKCMVLSDD